MMPTNRLVTITGGSGFVGRILQSGLRARGYEVSVFDRVKGPLVDFVRYRTLGTAQSRVLAKAAAGFRRGQALAERVLSASGAIRAGTDDILGGRDELVKRFRGSSAVIHLAAIPHPNVPGMTADDFRRINFDGAVNVFEAAREAGVRKFVFASSGQVYGINAPVHIDSLPILESNYLPTLEDGLNLYGFLKGEFERYLAAACRGSGIQAVALRLEFPGALSRFSWNLYISTSVENTIAGFACALEKEIAEFDVFNIADREVDPAIVNIPEYLKRQWPQVPDRTSGNECLMGTEKARRLLGYDPRTGGTYYSLGVMW